MCDIRHQTHSTDVAAAKAALRARLRAGRRTRPVLSSSGSDLADQVLSLPEVQSAQAVAAYVSTAHEPPTGVLLERLSALDRQVLLPVVLPDLDLDWALDDSSRQRGDGPGVLEPAGDRLGPASLALADVVVVPALAVDTEGRRLGQGGGSYDRALRRRRPGALAVALVHDDELLAHALPSADHDRRVDAVVTPSRILRFAVPARGVARPR